MGAILALPVPGVFDKVTGEMQSFSLQAASSWTVGLTPP
jgi:hypothetical protein